MSKPRSPKGSDPGTPTDDPGAYACALLASVLDGQSDQPEDDPPDWEGILHDQTAVYGLIRPGAWAGEVEALMLRVPTTIRNALRRAGRAIVAEHKAQNAPNRSAARLPPPPLPLVVAHDHSVLVYDGASYVYIARDFAVTMFDRANPDIGVWVPTQNEGQRRATLPELFDSHGVMVQRIHWRMGAQIPSYDPARSILTIPCCQWVQGRAAHSARVAEWLELLGASSHDRLLDWLATYNELDVPTSVLYLQGDAGTGKGMLVEALAALYGGARCSYDDVVLGGYNASLRDSPLIHLDERAAKDPRERGSGAFRSITGDSSRVLTEKHKSSTTIIGCPRTVVTANNADGLRLSREDIEAADEVAIGTRITHVLVGPNAETFLTDIGGRAETEGWCSADGELTSHLRWLIENRYVAHGKRLLVEGDSAAWLRSQAQRDGLPRQILVAVACAVADAANTSIHDVVSCDPSGTAYVSCRELHRHWGTLTGDDRRPNLQTLGRGLGRLGHRCQRNRRWVYPIAVHMILEVAQAVGVDTHTITHRLGGRP